VQGYECLYKLQTKRASTDTCIKHLNVGICLVTTVAYNNKNSSGDEIANVNFCYDNIL